jgi:hypothetical protein
MHLEAALVLPMGWKASSDILELVIPPGQDQGAGCSISVPEDWDRNKPRVALAADVRVDGKYLGQIAECVADIQFSA